jgi:hypothetical protein
MTVPPVAYRVLVLSSFSISLVKKNWNSGTGAMKRTEVEAPLKDEEGSLWRRLVLPEEDKRQLGLPLWDGIGYRWFRSPNVVPIEQRRRKRMRAAG